MSIETRKKQMSKIFGIDLGTTYSCISYIDESGEPIIIKNKEGDLTTPSVVLFDDEGIIVGKEAKENASLYPEKTISFIKTSITNNEFKFSYKDKDVTPAEISAHILKKIVSDAEESLNEKISDVVITCPAYFGINERRATQLAGELAGLNVIQIIDEPTAAAISYSLNNTNENKVVLIYDLGGGTFDVTLIDINSDEIKVISTGGDHNLGGKNWDNAILNYMNEQYQEQSEKDDTIFDSLTFQQEARVISENIKKSLSTEEITNVEFIYNNFEVKFEFSRETFNELTNDLLEKTISLTDSTIEDAIKLGYSLDNISEILLVGGSTNMPQIIEKVTAKYNKDCKIFDPDQAVAKGAALYACKIDIYQKSIKKIQDETGKELEQITPEEIKVAEQEIISDYEYTLTQRTIDIISKTITNITSKSFGVKIFAKTFRKEQINNIIIKNTAVPTSSTHTYGTLNDNQENVEIVVYENMEYKDLLDLDEGRKIGDIILKLPPNLPSNSPISVTFNLDVSGLLGIKAIDATHNQEISFEIITEGSITQEEIEAIKKEINK